MKTEQTKSPRHWGIVALMCLLSASSIGICTNSVGVFYTPVSEALHVLKGTFAMHATLSNMCTAIMALFMPKLMRKTDYRKLLLIGALLASIPTFFMGFTHSMMGFYILGILRGIGAGIFGIVPITMIITNWFQKSHGLATSITLSFSGLSGAVFSPLFTWCITNYGWEKAFFLMGGCLFLLTIPVCLVHWHTPPEEEGLLPYGYSGEHETKAVLQNTKFQYFSIGFLAMALFAFLHPAITGISQHISGMAESVGLSAQNGAFMVSLIMIGNVSSKLLIGILSDHTTPLKASICMIFVNICSLLLLYVGMLQANVSWMFAASVLFGTIYSVGAVGIPLLTRSFFGSENYQKAYSVIGFLTNAGSASSLTLIGYVADFTGSYIPVLFIAIGIHLFNMCLLAIAHFSTRN